MKLFSARNVMFAVLIILIASILIVMANGIRDFGNKAEQEQVLSAHNMIERAVVQCYALEGAYPPNLEYLGNYGIVPNYEKFIYNYEVVGKNVFPLIEVRVRD